MASKNATPKDPLNSIPETAYQLGLQVSTIRSWVWQRKIESVRVGRAVRIRQSAIDAVIEKGTTPADDRVAIA
jgi:excisionase family DNA binding protein